MLRLTYRIPDHAEGLLLPAAAVPKVRDQLWEHTCFEAFVRLRGAPEYIELNFSPSTEWAAYGFDDYREGMRAISLHLPKIISTPSGNRFELSAGVEMPPEWEFLRWRLNLCAILEERDGTKSHWALAHPPGKPDFHHPDCFVLDLPPPASS